MAKPPANVGQRFWAKVAMNGDGCWLWTGARGAAKEEQNKYGLFYLARVQDKEVVVYAHRLAFVLTYGPLPDGVLVRHTCDTRLCCQPRHLIKGDDSDNLRDQYERGRRRAAHFADGSKRWGGRANRLEVSDGGK